MTPDEAHACGYAASLAAANTPDRTAWLAGRDAVRSAEARAVAAFIGPVRLNRFGRPHGGAHPATKALAGYFELHGCYPAETSF